MKTRDEILELLHEELFSVRTAFFALLDACVVYKGHRLVWPDALTVTLWRSGMPATTAL